MASMSPPQHPPTIQYFTYARKSSESEDRQVASVDSQINELQAIAQRDNLAVVDVLSESQSAKAPGRPVFNAMLARIHQGEAQGILCWKLDRLARNPIDGGNISWMLQQGLLKRIQTHERTHCPADNVLMMAVELGMANQYVRDLSQNVKRGLKTKCEKGWYPGISPLGYLNSKSGERGSNYLFKDEERFPLLRKMWDLMLTGAYTRSGGRAAIKPDLDLVYTYFPRLAERKDAQAGYISGGEQQMTAIGRALMARPKLILLDEPSMGLAPQLVKEIFDIVKRLNEEEKVSFLLAEQNATMALRVADHGYILESGRVVLNGTGAELSENEDIKEFYLGLGSEGRKSYRDVKHYRRRKRWL